MSFGNISGNNGGQQNQPRKSRLDKNVIMALLGAAVFIIGTGILAFVGNREGAMEFIPYIAIVIGLILIGIGYGRIRRSRASEF